MQALGPAPEEAESAEQHYPGNGVGGLYETGAGKIVVHESLGPKARQQTLRHALVQVQVHGVVGEHSGVLEHDRANGSFPPPLGELLVRLAGGAEGIQGGGPARIRPRLAGKRRKGPDRFAILGAAFVERRGAHPLQRAGHRVAERIGRELHPAARACQQSTASLDLRFEILPSLAGRFQLLGRDTLLLPHEVGHLYLPCEAVHVPVTYATAKVTFDVVVNHLGEAAELALDGLGLLHQHFEDAVFGALRKHEVVAAHLRRGLELAIDTPVALLDAARIPGQVEVEEISAMRLKVESFTGSVSGDQDAQGVPRRIGIEAALDLLALRADGLPVDGLDAFLGKLGTGDRLFEHFTQVALGTDDVLRKDEHPPVVPAGRRPAAASLAATRQVRAQVLAYPFDEVASSWRPGGHGRQRPPPAFGRGGLPPRSRIASAPASPAGSPSAAALMAAICAASSASRSSSLYSARSSSAPGGFAKRRALASTLPWPGMAASLAAVCSHCLRTVLRCRAREMANASMDESSFCCKPTTSRPAAARARAAKFLQPFLPQATVLVEEAGKHELRGVLRQAVNRDALHQSFRKSALYFADIFLDASHHHVFERTLAPDRHSSGETIRVEQLEQG